MIITVDYILSVCVIMLLIHALHGNSINCTAVTHCSLVPSPYFHSEVRMEIETGCDQATHTGTQCLLSLGFKGHNKPTCSN